MTESQRRAKRKYYKEKTKHFRVDFYPSERELLEHLNAQPKKQTYIKNLIKNDIGRAMLSEGENMDTGRS